MPTVFINYRRDESAGEARALYTDMVAQLGEGAVFMDVDSIAPGLDFRDVVQQRLASCDVMLSLVGKEWLTITTHDGRRRLDDPSDFVRLEIEGALKRKIPVAPVLLHGAEMPPPDSLPESLRDFAFRNAFELSHTRWESDVEEMLRRLKLGHGGATGAPPAARASTSSDAAPSQSSRMLPVVLLLTVLVAGGIGAYLYFNRASSATTDATPTEGPRDTPAEQPSAPPDNPAPPEQTAEVHSATTAAPSGRTFVGQRLELGTQIGGLEMCVERMTIRPCASRPAQRWTFEASGTEDRVRIHNGAAGPNMCLDILNDGSSNSMLVLARCGEFSGQSWSVTPAGAAARFFQLRNDFSGRNRCLSAADQTDGTGEIRMAQCAGTPAQRWRLTPR